MDSKARVFATLEGQIPDRVPVFCAGIEDRTFFEVLGQPLIHNSKILRNPLVKWYLDKRGAKATKLLQKTITKGMRRRIESQVKLGFDCIWALYDETFIGRDSSSMLRYTGSIFDLIEDGYGNMSYYYREPAINSPEEYQAWPHWPDPESLAKSTYEFYQPLVKKYGDQAVFFAQGPHYGIFESLLWTLGFAKLSYWRRKHRDLINDYIQRCEAIMHACMMAMMDAGVEVVLQTDDMGFKTGALMAPEQLNEMFGPSYTRLVQAVHDRGGRFILHTCGDNTNLFQYFVDWGVDGVHALENTSTVDPFAVKQKWGDKLTLIGGVGIDYLLSETSTAAEVEEGTVKFLREMAPGGRFIIGPVHSETTIPADKLRVLIKTVHERGNYPIQ